MKKSFMTRILATGLSLAMAFSMAAATNVTTASAASKPAMITSAGASAKSLSLKVGEVTKIKVNAATKANYKVSAVKASSKRVRAAVVGSTVVAIRGLKATVEGKPSTVKVSFTSRKTKKTSKFTYSSKVTVIEDKLTVTGVSAADATTLTVTGTKLGDLTVADVQITPSVVVASYTAAADGKTATVKLSAGLQSKTEYTVAVNGSEFKVTYTAGEITSVAVTETSYDDDTPGQVLAISVNGGSPITVNDLIADGYFVEFSVTSNGVADNQFFKAGTANRSMTGVLGAPVEKGDYKVQVVLSKGSSIITSPMATVKVVNLDADATSFESYVLAGLQETTATNKGYSISNVKLTSKTLVAGETAVLTEAAIKTADGKVTLPKSVVKKVGVTSDNINVIQIKTFGDEKRLYAVAPGTANITFAYGSVKMTVAYTVVNADRYPAVANAKVSSLRAIKNGATIGAIVVVKDQYGDFVQGLSFTDKARLYSSNTDIATVQAFGSTNTKGEATVDVQGIGVGTAYLSYSYRDGNLNKDAYTAATIYVSEEREWVAAKNKLAVVAGTGYSSDMTLDVYDKTADDKVKIQWNTYTINDALVTAGATIEKGSYFKYNAAVLSLASASANWIQTADDRYGYNRATVVRTGGFTDVEFIAKGAGTTDLSLFASNGAVIATTSVTVVDTKPYLKGVTINASCPDTLTYAGQTINYTKVFNIEGSSNNDIIKGATVAQAYPQLRIIGTVRSDSLGKKSDGTQYDYNDRVGDATVTAGAIYVDMGSDGLFDADDTIIGYITVDGDNATFASKPLATYTLTEGGSKKTITYTVKDRFTGNVVAAKAIVVEK